MNKYDNDYTPMIGDIVERVFSTHGGMVIGDRAIIVAFCDDIDICLDKYNGTEHKTTAHTIRNLKLIQRAPISAQCRSHFNYLP